MIPFASFTMANKAAPLDRRAVCYLSAIAAAGRGAASEVAELGR